jgi:hypothetical protein
LDAFTSQHKRNATAIAHHAASYVAMPSLAHLNRKKQNSQGIFMKEKEERALTG